MVDAAAAVCGNTHCHHCVRNSQLQSREWVTGGWEVKVFTFCCGRMS